MVLRLTYQSGTRINDWSQSAILGDRGAAARNFADLVATRLIGTVLPFSERESLVRVAAKYGINRFEANLLIAAVQHQMGVGRKRLEKRGGLRAIVSSIFGAFMAGQRKILAAIQRRWLLARQWAIARRVWPTLRVPFVVTAVLMRASEIIQHQWRLTREWAIEKRLLPKFLVVPVMEAQPEMNLSVMRTPPGVVRRRAAQRESMRVRIPSALATFLAVQAGIVVAVWYLFSY